MSTTKTINEVKIKMLWKVIGALIVILLGFIAASSGMNNSQLDAHEIKLVGHESRIVENEKHVATDAVNENHMKETIDRLTVSINTLTAAVDVLSKQVIRLEERK